MQRAFFKFAMVGAAFAAMVGITVLIIGQPASKLIRQSPSPRRVGVVDDWSHHHLVFSNPGTYQQAAKTGASYAKWLAIRYDTRFIFQQMRRHAEAIGGLSSGTGSGDLAIGIFPQSPGEGRTKPRPKPQPRPKAAPFKRDWSTAMLNGTVQPNIYPATWAATPTSPSCSSDFAAYPTGAVSTSIVAYNNLYSGCPTGTVPSVYWAYNTGGNTGVYNAHGATISTSPIVSGDGSQVAFIQSDGTESSLVLLKWAGGAGEGTVGSPVTPIYQSNSYYRGYTELPCMTFLGHYGLTFANVTYSAPFYDFASDDALYVGDDGGYLHKFTGIFYGTPAEVTTSPWPVRLTTSAKLTSPVYDAGSGYVFVGDTGGFLYAVGSGNAGTTSGAVHGTSSSLGDVIIDAPLVDSTAGKVYVFVTSDGSTKNAVFQFSTTFTSGSGNSVEVGTGGTGYYLYAGDFDNVYYQSSAPTGNLYVVGNTGVATGATLYQIPVTSSVMGTPNAIFTGLTSTDEYPWPSPIIEFCNNGASDCVSNGTKTTSGTDYLFFSVNSGAETGCTTGDGNGCVLSYNVSNPASPAFSAALNVTNVGSPGCWATSGLVIDNSVPGVTITGASQVYFIGLNGNTAGGAAGATSSACASGVGTPTLQATQASQAGLH